MWSKDRLLVPIGLTKKDYTTTERRKVAKLTRLTAIIEQKLNTVVVERSAKYICDTLPIEPIANLGHGCALSVSLEDI